jgi:two-component sensor histidine kinase
VFHELATNAAKYGALSTADGRVDVEIIRLDDGVRITWCETGGPVIDGEPVRTGFGTRLAELSVAQQLGGLIERNWKPSGLCVKIEVLINRLNRDL